MPDLYKVADAMLVTLEDKPYANMTIPGKVQSYMASGKPIIGSINGSCADFIKNNEIGYVCSSVDGELLAKGLDINIMKDIRKVYFKEYSKDMFIDFVLLWTVL